MTDHQPKPRRASDPEHLPPCDAQPPASRGARAHAAAAEPPDAPGPAPREIPHCATPTAHLVGPARLSLRDGVLLYCAYDGTRLRLDLHQLRQLSLYGCVTASADALAALVEHHADVVWLSPGGQRLRARMAPFCEAALSLRLRQYQLQLQPSRRRPLAQAIVEQRIASLARLVRQWQRHGQRQAGNPPSQLLALYHRAGHCRSVDELRGLEGLATARFFEAFAARLQRPWTFPGRRRRPPTDPVNAMLSLSATLLVRRALTRLQAEGLEPALGVLHQFRPGRPSLACDVVEPLRAVFVEQFTLQACNQRWVAPDDFLPCHPQTGVRLNHEAFPRFLARWEQFYLDNSGPQRLGRVVAQYLEQLRAVPLPGHLESCAPPESSGCSPPGPSAGDAPSPDAP